MYSELIKFRNNISIARNVDFLTHDIIHGVLNRYASRNNVLIPDGNVEVVPKFREEIGCIEIMDDVFVRSNSVIMYNTGFISIFMEHVNCVACFSRQERFCAKIKSPSCRQTGRTVSLGTSN